MLCMRQDPSTEEALPAATALDLANLKTVGESCHLHGDHGCVIDNLGGAYWAMGRAEQVDALGLKYVRWVSESCDQWLERAKTARTTQQAGPEQYRSRLQECSSILQNQISEIEVQRPPKGEHHKQQRQAIRREVKWSNEHLPVLARKLRDELDQIDELPLAPTPPTKIEPKPVPPPRVELDPKGFKGRATPPKLRPTGPTQDQAFRDTRIRYAVDVIVVVGGGLAVLSGASLMVNGAAWTSCSRKYDDATHEDSNGKASTRCAQLLGLAEATDLSSVFGVDEYTPNDFEVASDVARKNSTRNWVLGALVIGAAAGVITVGAIDLEKVLDIRKKYSLTASWSPASPHAGALSFMARF